MGISTSNKSARSTEISIRSSEPKKIGSSRSLRQTSWVRNLTAHGAGELVAFGGLCREEFGPCLTQRGG